MTELVFGSVAYVHISVDGNVLRLCEVGDGRHGISERLGRFDVVEGGGRVEEADIALFERILLGLEDGAEV